MTTLYGIKNCDTVRKARQWLDAHGIDYTFHDLRSDGVSEADLRRWADAVGWETLLNRRSTTWRQLPASAREGIDAERAIALMREHPTLIKRPVLQTGETLLVGFKPDDYAALFG